MKKVKILACMLCLILCCGCWDKHELEDQTFVVMLGIDKADNENIVVTAAFPLTQIGGSGGEDGGEYTVMSAKAPTMVEALSMFSTKLAGPLSLFSAKTIVISEELARDDMLRHVLSSWRYEQTRNNTNVLISKCGAAEFIKARLKDPVIDPLRQEDLILEQANYSAYYRAVQFLDLIVSIQSDHTGGVAMYGGIAGDSGEKGEDTGKDGDKEKSREDTAETEEAVQLGYLPGEVPLKADNPSQICGLAVFGDGSMVGVLDSHEAQTYAMMTRSKTRKILTLPDPLDPGSNIVVSILPTRKSRIRGYFIDGSPTFDVTVDLRCAVESVQNDTDYASGRNYDILTEYIREVCEGNMRELVLKSQKDYNADILKLGNKLARNFLTIREWEDYNWRERYRDAQINIEVNLDIERTGIYKP